MTTRKSEPGTEIGPDAVTLWAEKVAELVREVELELIRLVKKSVAADMGASAYTVGRLAEIALVYARAQQMLGRDWQQVIAEAEEILLSAQQAGQGNAVTDLLNSGIAAKFPPQMTLAVEMTAMDTLTAITGMPPLILRQVSDAYQSLMAGPVSMVSTGAVTRIQATEAALQKWARNGIPGFIDRAGREWSMDAYAEMAVRTGAMNAMREGYAGTLTLNGMDLIRVTGHGYTCPACGRWQGKVLSLTGETPTGWQHMLHAVEDRYVSVHVAGTVQEATDDGLFHPNCAHSTGLYLPGVTTLYKGPENAPTYEASQKQRAMEVEIRKLKRELAASLTPESETQIHSQIRGVQKNIRELLDEHPMLQRKPIREQIKTAH